VWGVYCRFARKEYGQIEIPVHFLKLELPSGTCLITEKTPIEGFYPKKIEKQRKVLLDNQSSSSCVNRD